MTIFDGYTFAEKREAALARRVAELVAPALARPRIQVAAILFAEDKGSQLYTGLKQQAAERVGITYTVHTFSMKDPVDQVLATLRQLNTDPAVTGIIIQKPWRKTWEAVMGVARDPDVEQTVFNHFPAWWAALVSQIDVTKDVDGLHPETLSAIERGTWQVEGKVLPATAKAVLSILGSVNQLKPQKYVIIGKSDILGRPLAFELKNLGFTVDVVAKKELEQRLESGQALKDADVVVAATGHHHLVKGEMLKSGVILVDVGEPRPDVDRQSVELVASFLTPVPGGVGPVTVISLLENAVELGER